MNLHIVVIIPQPPTPLPPFFSGCPHPSPLPNLDIPACPPYHVSPFQSSFIAFPPSNHPSLHPTKNPCTKPSPLQTCASPLPNISHFPSPSSHPSHHQLAPCTPAATHLDPEILFAITFSLIRAFRTCFTPACVPPPFVIRLVSYS